MWTRFNWAGLNMVRTFAKIVIASRCSVQFSSVHIRWNEMKWDERCEQGFTTGVCRVDIVGFNPHFTSWKNSYHKLYSITSFKTTPFAISVNFVKMTKRPHWAYSWKCSFRLAVHNWVLFVVSWWWLVMFVMLYIIHAYNSSWYAALPFSGNSHKCWLDFNPRPAVVKFCVKKYASVFSVVGGGWRDDKNVRAGQTGVGGELCHVMFQL